MSLEKRHINYTANDIDLYLSGKLSPLQRHAMEKAALEDPFLAEAMEGYEAAEGTNWQATLAALKTDFANKEQGAKLVTMHPAKTKWWKAVAAVLLLGGFAALTYNLVNPNEPVVKENGGGQIAAIDPQQPGKPVTATPQPAMTTPVIKPGTKSVVTASAQKPLKQEQVTAGIPVASESLNTAWTGTDRLGQAGKSKETNKDQHATTAYNNTIAAVSDAKKTTSPKTDSTFNNPIAGKIAGAPVAVAAVPSSTLSRSFNAAVSAPDNTPLPFANISIVNENFGTYADVKGNFRLLYPDTLLTVEVKAAGYKAKNFQLRSSQLNKIVLTQEMMPSNETTVIRNRNNPKMVSRRVLLLRDTAIKVEPADGWDNYNKYVANNIDIPEEMLQKNLHGDLEITFDVQSNGAITNVRVDKSQCSDCDEAAKRIIEQGPQWKTKKGKSTSGKIRLRF